MKASKDPFESTLSEQDDESPPDSPPENRAEEDDDVANPNPNSLARNTGAKSKGKGKGKEELEEEEDYDDEVDMEEEEDNQMDIDTQLRNKKVMSSSAASVSAAESNDPHKMAKMQSILSQFTEEQMSRYESFRRSGFQKSIMKRVNKIKSNSKATRYAALALLKSKFELLVSITGSAKISVPMTIVVSGIAKMFVGELVETARVVMAERKDSGPIRPCHIRESYRRLKLEGKIPKRSVPRLFR